MGATKLTMETVRLLLHVAWADHEIAPEEYDYVLRLAQNGGMSPEEVRKVDACLRNRKALQEPDIAYLKPYRDEVLAHVQLLIQADMHIAEEETAILHRIASLL